MDGVIRAAYESCHNNIIGQGVIGVVSVICLIIMISKIINIYEKNHTKDGINIKAYWDLIKQFGKYIAFICLFPFVIGAVEYAFAGIQDGLSSSYNSSITMSGEEAIKEYIKEFEDQELELEEESSINPLPKIINEVKKWWFSYVLGLYIGCLYVLKYIYFFFAAGRYLWLLMLEAVAPIAVILSLSKDTFSYFVTWLKHMLVCYLMIPFFLMADAFSEALVKNLFEMIDLGTIGILGVIAAIVIKIAMFAVVTKKTSSII